MQNATLIYHYARQPNVTIIVVTAKGDTFEFHNANTLMQLYMTGGNTVLEVIRYSGEDVIGTIHFPNPASIELKGDKKP